MVESRSDGRLFESIFIGRFRIETFSTRIFDGKLFQAKHRRKQNYSNITSNPTP